MLQTKTHGIKTPSVRRTCTFTSMTAKERNLIPADTHVYTAILLQKNDQYQEWKVKEQINDPRVWTQTAGGMPSTYIHVEVPEFTTFSFAAYQWDFFYVTAQATDKNPRPHLPNAEVYMIQKLSQLPYFYGLIVIFTQTNNWQFTRGFKTRCVKQMSLIRQLGDNFR